MTEKKTIEKKQSNILEIILVTVGTIAWIVLQVLAIFQVDIGALEQTEYVANSFVGNATAIPAAAFGVAWVYMYILHAVFYVIGNHAQAALWLQFALQLLGAVLLYRGIRKLCGRVVAVIFYLGVLFLPCFLISVEDVQPLWIVFSAVSVVVYLVATLLRVGKKKKETDSETEPDTKAENPLNSGFVNEQPVRKADVKAQTETKPEPEAKPQVKLLDNPLPGPKKHVSKVLDYDLKLERMPRVFQRYDIKVSDDDDFDIK